MKYLHLVLKLPIVKYQKHKFMLSGKNYINPFQSKHLPWKVIHEMVSKLKDKCANKTVQRIVMQRDF